MPPEPVNADMAPFTQQVEDPLVSSEILLGTDRAAQALNIDVEPVLREHGIDPALLVRPQGYLRHEQVTRFLQAVGDRFGCEDFGFVLGKVQPPVTLGSLGRIMASSPTLGAAIDNGLRFHSLFSEGSVHEMQISEGNVTLSRWNAVAYRFATTQMRMLGIVMLFRLIQGLAGGYWQPGHVSFSFGRTRNAAMMARHFGCPVAFDQALDALVFPEEDLARVVPSADPRLLSILLDELSPLLVDHGRTNVVWQTESYIRRAMGTGRCNLEGCAQVLRVQPRTLQRELARFDTTFRQLLLNLRMDLARQLLLDSTIRPSDIATILGYRGQSAFTRAFNQRFGVSPTQWRAHAQKIFSA